MLTTILFVLALATSIWITALMIARVLYNERIFAWHFIFFALSWTAIITHFIDIW